jgi:hypothetical protein
MPQNMDLRELILLSHLVSDAPSPFKVLRDESLVWGSAVAGCLALISSR